MITLSATQTIAKNQLFSSIPWLVLLEITIPDAGGVLRLVRNNENITYNGQQYSAFPFELDDRNDSADGQIPVFTIRVSNVSRVVQGYVEQYNGFEGATVRLMRIYYGDVSTAQVQLDMVFDVVSVSCSSEWVSFNLGAPNAMQSRYPIYRASARACQWIYKGAECNYKGTLETCNHTFNDCANHNNLIRFGGRPGIKGGIRVA